jgi:WD40 repeat protein
MNNKPEEISPDFEDEIRAALQVPPAETVFVTALRSQILEPQRVHRALASRRWTRRAWMALFAALLLTTLAVAVIGPQKVWAAVRGWFGYVPGVGFVQGENSLRIVEAPLVQDREGISVTIDEGLADARQTTLHYHVEGIRSEQRPASESDTGCIESPYLSLPDGTRLEAGGGSANGWPSGYNRRDVFPAVPAAVDRFTLIIPCLMDTRPGAAPEDWEFSLQLSPAPQDFHVLPVIEIPTPTLQPTGSLAANPVSSAATFTMQPAAPTETPAIQLQVEKMVELPDGYIFQGSMKGKATAFSPLNFDTYQLQITDAQGKRILFEPIDPPADSQPSGPNRLVWAVQTRGKGYASPLTFSLPSVTLDQPAQASFDLDLGPDPQSGQTWELNQDVTVDNFTLRILSAQFDARVDGTYWLSFEMQVDPHEIEGVSLQDLDNHSAKFSGAGGGDGSGSLSQSFSYDYRPQGVRHIQIQRITTYLYGPWTAALDLPAPQRTAEQPEATSADHACLAGVGPGSAPTTLPDGLNGWLIVEGPVAPGKTFPTLFLASLDSSQRTEIGPGGWASLSPDGKRVAYIYSDGMHIFDQGQDYHPLWSPDGQRQAFVRGADGIYITRPDGSDLHRTAGSSPSMLLSGWLPDGNGLLVTRLGNDGSRLQTLDLASGKTEDGLLIDNRKGGSALLSPDGQQVAFSEITFGEKAYGVYLAQLDGSQQRLLASPQAGTSISPAAWSPDGQWLLVSSWDADVNTTANYLIQPDSCQVLRLPDLNGQVTAWVKK